MDTDQVGGPLQRRTQHSSVIQGPSGDHDGLPAGTAPLGRRVSIGVLSDDVLLVVFGFYRESSSLRWHRLAHVCQRWRRIVFASPRTLRLCLFCTPSTPVRRTVDCWPALPLILRFGSWPSCITPEGDDNIVAALKHHDRVRSVELFLTDSLVDKLNAQVKEPFSELMELFLKSESNKPLILPGPRHWSTHLRILRLERSFLPSLPVLLFYSPNLVCLELHDLPIGFPSPGVLAQAFAGMSRLEALSLRFFPASHLLQPLLPIPSRRPVLPALTKLHFQGVVDYLGDLVTGIDAPCLGKFTVTLGYLSDSQTDRLSQLGQFIDRTEAQRSHTRVEIQISDDYVSIVFNQSAHKSPSHFILSIHRIGLFNQLSTMTGICNHFPAFLLGLGYLGVVTVPLSCTPDTVDGENWLRLLRPFSDATKFHLAGEFAKPIMHALQNAGEESETVLPALRELSIEMEPEPHCDWEPLWLDVRSFTTSRQLSGRPVDVAYGELPCECECE